MSAFDKVMEVMFDKEYDDLVWHARSAAEALESYFENRYDGDWLFPLAFLISSVVVADGVFSKREQRFLEDVLGDSQGYFISMVVGAHDSGMGRAAEAILEAMPFEYNHHALFFVAAFATVDGRVCNEEARLIRLLLN